MHTEREIDALLSPSEAGSIFDRLMAMPHAHDSAAQANEWDRAVASRFQAHLVREMRSVLDNGGCQKNAA